MNVFVKFESRKAELEIESAVQKTELIHKAKELLCCTIADVKLMRFDKSSDQWSLVSSSKLYLKDGENFKLRLVNYNIIPLLIRWHSVMEMYMAHVIMSDEVEVST